jgi:hypothetical protein
MNRYYELVNDIKPPDARGVVVESREDDDG